MLWTWSNKGCLILNTCYSDSSGCEVGRKLIHLPHDFTIKLYWNTLKCFSFQFTHLNIIYIMNITIIYDINMIELNIVIISIYETSLLVWDCFYGWLYNVIHFVCIYIQLEKNPSLHLVSDTFVGVSLVLFYKELDFSFAFWKLP